MRETETLYLKVGEPVPFTHHRVYEVDVPALDPTAIKAITADPPIEVTSCETPGNFREFLPSGGVTVVTAQSIGDFDRSFGKVVLHRLRLPREHLSLALNGGGTFVIARPNPLYDQPLTHEQWEEQERENEEVAALEASEWD